MELHLRATGNTTEQANDNILMSTSPFRIFLQKIYLWKTSLGFCLKRQEVRYFHVDTANLLSITLVDTSVVNHFCPPPFENMDSIFESYELGLLHYIDKYLDHTIAPSWFQSKRWCQVIVVFPDLKRLNTYGCINYLTPPPFQELYREAVANIEPSRIFSEPLLHVWKYLQVCIFWIAKLTHNSNSLCVLFQRYCSSFLAVGFSVSPT